MITGGIFFFLFFYRPKEHCILSTIEFYFQYYVSWALNVLNINGEVTIQHQDDNMPI